MRSFLLAAIVCAVAAPAVAIETQCKGNEKNLETYLKMYDVLFMKRDESRVLEFYAPEFVSHNSDAGGGGAETRTAESMKPMWIDSKKNQPDRVMINELILCAGNLVVARVTMKGTQTGPLFGMTATGKTYSTTATDIYRFKDGKVVEQKVPVGHLIGVLLPFAQAQAARAEKK